MHKYTVNLITTTVETTQVEVLAESFGEAEQLATESYDEHIWSVLHDSGPLVHSVEISD